MPSADEALFWLPTAAVAAVALLALIVALAQPRRLAKAVWIVVTLIVGTAAIGAAAWRQGESRVEIAGEAAKLRAVGAHLDEVGRQLPPAGQPSRSENFDSVPGTVEFFVGRKG